jgi:hypothetical protein
VGSERQAHAAAKSSGTAIAGAHTSSAVTCTVWPAAAP